MENPVINYTGDYVPARVAEYEPLKLQLDKLWHDIDDGKFGADAKTGSFYASIKAIKDAHPK